VILDALLVSSGGVRPKTFVKLPNGDYGLRMPDAESFNRLKDAVILVENQSIPCAAMSSPRKDQILEFKLLRIPFFAQRQDVISAVTPYGRVTRITEEIRKDLMVGTGNLLVTAVKTPGAKPLGRSLNVLGRDLAVLHKGMCAKCYKMGHVRAACPERKLNIVSTEESNTNEFPSVPEPSTATEPEANHEPEETPSPISTPEPSPEVQMLPSSSPDPLLLPMAQDMDTSFDDTMTDGDTIPDEDARMEELFPTTTALPRQSGSGSKKVQHTRRAIFDIFPTGSSNQSPIGPLPTPLAGKKRDRHTRLSGSTSQNNKKSASTQQKGKNMRKYESMSEDDL